MYKLCAALVVSFIAALAALVAGIMTEARMETVLIRSAVCFVFFGVILSAGVLLVDKFNLNPLGWLGVETPVQDEADEDDGEEPVADKAAIAEEQEEAGGFVPLATDNLRHVSTQ